MRRRVRDHCDTARAYSVRAQAQGGLVVAAGSLSKLGISRPGYPSLLISKTRWAS